MHVVQVYFVDMSLRVADGVNVGNNRKGNYRSLQVVWAKHLNELCHLK